MTIIKETEYFNLYAISDGVYAAISKPGNGAWSNAGIVDLGDELLVFDSFTTPSAGYELRRQAEEITSKEVKYLINSHFHGDHVFGNQAFIDTTIISTSVTKIMSKEKNEISDLDKETTEMEEYLNSLMNRIEDNQESIIKVSLQNQLDEMSKVLEELSHLRMVLPQLLFEEKLIIEGTKRKVELYCLGGGHTPSDTFMYLPKEKIAFMGDLVTEDLHLPIHNPEEFVLILEKVKHFDIQTVVPGHGNIGNKDMINSLAEYLKFLIKESIEALESKVSLEHYISTFKTPYEYSEWKGVNGVRDNLSKLYTYYAERF